MTSTHAVGPSRVRRDESEVVLLSGQVVSGRHYSALGRLASYAMLLAAFLPYVRTSPLVSDVQPHALVVFFGLYLWSRPTSATRDPRLGTAVALGFVYAALLLLLSSVQYAVAAFFVPVFAVLLLHEDRRLVARCARIALATYVFGCLLELGGAAGLVERLTANPRTSAQRGLHSFTSEPSYLAIVGLTLFCFFVWQRARWPWIAATVAVVLLSGSVVGIVPLVIVAGLFAVRGLRPRRVLIFLATVLLVAVVGNQVIDTSSRLYSLVSLVSERPTALLDDMSAANRTVRALGPLYLAAGDGFRPHNYSGEERLYVEWGLTSGDFDQAVERLSSVLSVVVYVLGWLALPLVVALVRARHAPPYVVATLAYLFAANISALTPYVVVVLALFMARDSGWSVSAIAPVKASRRASPPPIEGRT